MTAGTIHLCGTFGGKMSGPNHNNKKGMFENTAIRNNIIKPFLVNQLNVDRLGQHPLPDIRQCHELSGAWWDTIKRRTESIMREHGYTGGPWFYKGAKMCLMWPIWHAAFPKAHWIIVQRKREGIIQSCLRTGFMRAYRDADGWGRWIDAHLERFSEMQAAGLDIHFVEPEKMIDGDFDEIRRTVRELGLAWNGDAVKDFVSAALWSRGTAVANT
jgi:hypothetical protein